MIKYEATGVLAFSGKFNAPKNTTFK